MTLHIRATRATRSIGAAVASASPVGMRAVARRRRRSLGAGLVGALAVLFASVALASILPVFSPSEAAHQPSPDGNLAVIEGSQDGPRLHSGVSDSPEPYALFSGAADPGTIVSATSEYGSAGLVVGESGEWALELRLDDPPPGVEFPIVLAVGDQVFTFGFTSLWDPEAVDITAHQTYGASDDAHPYEKFFGTGPPGTVVTAISDYGAVDTTAGEHGQWSIVLWFEGAPEGDGFPVTVTVGDEVFTFSFVWLPAPGGSDVEVKVTQHGTSSESANPYTQFVGTAPAGTQVLATSAYGSADLVVGESGEFSLKVWFSNPPAGVRFPITVKVDGEVYGEYHFTSHHEAPDADEVTVHQYNESSEAPDPYAKFYGTAPKGTKIQLISQYGSASMTTEYAGEWLLKLWFSSLPPAGVEFPITVKVNGETYGTYGFTSYFDGEIEITVNQYNTESDSPDPYVKFYGTAPIGTEIRIISPYGSTSWTTEAYEWLGKLWFTSLPPAGEEFEVTVKIDGEVFGTYPFTSWYEEGETAVTVDHAFDSCSEDPPFDDLWGTAPAGTQIKIISDYGSTTLTVGESGHWEKRQYFEGAPYGTPFTVTVKVNGSVHTTYQFTVNTPD